MDDNGKEAVQTPSELTDEQMWDDVVAESSNAPEDPQDTPAHESEIKTAESSEPAVEQSEDKTTDQKDQKVEEIAKEGAAVSAEPEKVVESKPESQVTDAVNADLLAELRTMKGRVSSLQSQVAKAEALRDQVPGIDPASLEEMPEVANLVKETLEAQLSPLRNQLAQMAQLTSAQAQSEALAQQAAESQQEQELSMAHPDWRDTLSDGDKLNSFLNDPSTPQGVVRAYQANEQGIVDARSAGSFVEAFKSYVGQTQAAPAATQEQAVTAEPDPKTAALERTRQRQLAASAGVEKATTAPVTSSIGDEASPEEMWDFVVSKYAGNN